MFLAASILAFAIAADDVKAGDLVPIEQGVADRSATSTSLRVQPAELSQSTNFQKVFGVVGRPDLLVRSQGGLYAVFDQGAYRTIRGKTYSLWPSGTVYHIGQPDFTHIKGGGVRAGQVGGNLPPGTQLQQKSSGGPDARIGVRPVEGLIRVTPLSERAVNEPASSATPAKVPVKDAGYGHHSADAPPAPAAVAPAAPAPKDSPAPPPPAQSPKDAPAQPSPKS